MKTREHAAAVLSDLEAEMARAHPSYNRLYKFAALSSMALWLRQQTDLAEHDWLTGELKRIADMHGLQETSLWAREDVDAAKGPLSEQIIMPDIPPSPPAIPDTQAEGHDEAGQERPTA